MSDITHLLLRARSGDQTAFADVVNSLQTDVQRFCAGCVNWTEAADLAQETFLRAWKSLDTFRGESNGRAWLFGVARNVVADHVRRSARRGSIRKFHAIPDETGAGLVEQTDATEHFALLALIGSLPDEQRQAFVLTQLVGLSYEEAAESMSVAVGTIRSRVARARAHLIGALAQADHSGADRIEADHVEADHIVADRIEANHVEADRETA
jgi:RNA polymerase sigma-70 factor, ECF subfamily